MASNIAVLTLGMLKKQLAELEKVNTVDDETKIFLDTGWDSIQEIAPDALTIGEAQQFVVEDEWTKEKFNGFTLVEKAEKMNVTGEKETVIVIKNLY
ncbi:hypothetical protein ACMUXA_000518 [Enterococcus hirae]|nr:hypothetical protein [Enterococcus hirae]EMF0459515.1 hypothetical protein [Enterococcus hirae]MEE1498671.1 hypothetical protein [Enterococcus hirae]